MMFGSFARLSLCVIVLFLVLEKSRASDYEGNGRNIVSLDSLLNIALDGTDAAYANGRKNLLGRKMLQGVDEESSYRSRKNKPACLDEEIRKPKIGSGHFNIQKMPSGNQISSKRLRAPRKLDKIVFVNSVYFNGRKLLKNTKAFLEAADEIANLMRKDYSGRDRPKRKPPINNHEPYH